MAKKKKFYDSVNLSLPIKYIKILDKIIENNNKHPTNQPLTRSILTREAFQFWLENNPEVRKELKLLGELQDEA